MIGTLAASAAGAVVQPPISQDKYFDSEHERPMLPQHDGVITKLVGTPSALNIEVTPLWLEPPCLPASDNNFGSALRLPTVNRTTVLHSKSEIENIERRYNHFRDRPGCPQCQSLQLFI
jgi:hypothetical protein